MTSEEGASPNTSDEYKNAKTFLTYVPIYQPTRDALSRYLLVAYAISLATCFTTLGSGWGNAGLVNTILQVIPFFVGGLIICIMPIGLSQINNYQLIQLEHAIKIRDINKETVLYKRCKKLFWSEVFSLIISCSIFLSSITYCWHKDSVNDTSSRVALEFSPLTITNHSLELLAKNVGGKTALIMGGEVLIDWKKTNNMFDLPPPQGWPLYINPGDQKTINLNFSQAYTQLTNIIKKISQDLMLGRTKIQCYAL